MPRYFVRNPGRLLDHAEIMNEIWGPAYSDQVQYLRVYVRRLRKIIEPDSAVPAILLMELGGGYRLIMRPPQVALSDQIISLNPSSPVEELNSSR